MIRAVKAGDWENTPDGGVVAGGIELLPAEYTERLVAADPTDSAALPGTGFNPLGGLVVLDTGLTPELVAEGLARDLVRVVQQARREAGLAVSDRIALTVDAPDAVLAAARRSRGSWPGRCLPVASSTPRSRTVSRARSATGSR